MDFSTIKRIPLQPFKNRMVAIAIACLSLFLLLYFSYLADEISNTKMARTEEADLTQRLKANINKQSALASSLKDFSEIKKQYTTWKSRLVRNDDLLEIINEILKIGAKNRLLFNTFDPGDKIRTGNYYKIPIDVTVSGNYHHFALFVSQIANLPWIIEVGDFTINNNAETSNSEMLITELTLDIYEMPEGDNDANQQTS